MERHSLDAVLFVLRGLFFYVAFICLKFPSEVGCKQANIIKVLIPAKGIYFNNTIYRKI